MRRTRSIAVGVGAGALAVAGCGAKRQDDKEPRGTFPVEITRATFPASQHVSHRERMTLTIRNAGTKAIPLLAVSIYNRGKGTKEAAFAQNTQQVGHESRSKPIWVVDQGPKGGETAYSNTWAVGSLAPGHSATLRWKVLPVRPGTFGIKYLVAAGLNGKARAVLPGGGPPQGAFRVRITSEPRQTRVSDDGSVVEGGLPSEGGGKARRKGKKG